MVLLLTKVVPISPVYPSGFLFNAAVTPDAVTTAFGDIVIKNGNITAYAAEATNSSRGIECNGDITICGGTVAAKAEKGETFSYGLESDKKITIPSFANMPLVPAVACALAIIVP